MTLANRRLMRDAVGWGLLLWLIGYALGVALYFVVPVELIGWVELPIGTAITVWVLVGRVRGDDLPYYLALGSVWTAIAILLDYVFIVRALHPVDGYYKLDVYAYYCLTFALPLVIGWWKHARRTPQYTIGT